MAVERKVYSVDQFDHYLALPENRDRLFELVDGEIVEKMPTEAHGLLESYIAWLMNNVVIPNDLGRVLTNARFRLASANYDSRLPDIAFRAKPAAPVVTQGAISDMPDLAVEIQSPDDSDKEIEAKARYYIANGSRLVWNIKPRTRTIDVYRADGERVELTGADVLSGDDVLPGFAASVESIFARLDG